MSVPSAISAYHYTQSGFESLCNKLNEWGEDGDPKQLVIVEKQEKGQMFRAIEVRTDNAATDPVDLATKANVIHELFKANEDNVKKLDHRLLSELTFELKVCFKDIKPCSNYFKSLYLKERNLVREDVDKLVADIDKTRENIKKTLEEANEERSVAAGIRFEAEERRKEAEKLINSEEAKIFGKIPLAPDRAAVMGESLLNDQEKFKIRFFCADRDKNEVVYIDAPVAAIFKNSSFVEALIEFKQKEQLDSQKPKDPAKQVTARADAWMEEDSQKPNDPAKQVTKRADAWMEEFTDKVDKSIVNVDLTEYSSKAVDYYVKYRHQLSEGLTLPFDTLVEVEALADYLRDTPLLENCKKAIQKWQSNEQYPTLFEQLLSSQPVLPNSEIYKKIPFPKSQDATILPKFAPYGNDEIIKEIRKNAPVMPSNAYGAPTWAKLGLNGIGVVPPIPEKFSNLDPVQFSLFYMPEGLDYIQMGQLAKSKLNIDYQITNTMKGRLANQKTTAGWVAVQKKLPDESRSKTPTQQEAFIKTQLGDNFRMPTSLEAIAVAFLTSAELDN